tara:strand:- start:91 stop:507 length:417 start_codon:yes stop_codon:yes gene_type:complete
MENKNIWHLCDHDTSNQLELHEDNRGKIKDIFYNQNIKHIAMITSKPNVIRGNHYHKDATQHILITKGSLEYWYKKLNSNESAQHILMRKGDFVTTPNYEIHALKILSEGCDFIAFSEGLRGGKDYEKDTFRVESIIK